MAEEQIHSALRRASGRLRNCAAVAAVLFILYLAVSAYGLFVFNCADFQRIGASAVATGILLFAVASGAERFFDDYEIRSDIWKATVISDESGGLRFRNFSLIGAREGNRSSTNKELFKIGNYAFGNLLAARKLIGLVEVFFLVLGTLHWGFGDLLANTLTTCGDR
ncbi:MAG: hypothetical protein V3R90_15165 [Limibaculum sp.]